MKSRLQRIPSICIQCSYRLRLWSSVPRIRQIIPAPRSYASILSYRRSRPEDEPWRGGRHSPQKTPLDGWQHSKIRQELRAWNAAHANEELRSGSGPADLDPIAHDPLPAHDVQILTDQQEHDDDDDRDHDSVYLDDGTTTNAEDLRRFPEKGHIVRLASTCDGDSQIAIFMRPITLSRYAPALAQCLDARGHVCAVRPQQIRRSTPSDIPDHHIDAMIPYLPTSLTTKQDDVVAMSVDVSVPRTVSAPLVSRLRTFYSECAALYQRHASRLDDAHVLLAHPTDLLTFTVEHVACTLFRVDHHQLTPVHMFTTEAALQNAGFAIIIDNTTHRFTDIIRIRPLADIESAIKVRHWLRTWQDLKIKNGLRGVADHKKDGFPYIDEFVAKVRTAVKRSRKIREFTGMGMLGPCKDKSTTETLIGPPFSEQEQVIIRFLELSCCTFAFASSPSWQSLPSLILQATHMYEGQALDRATCWTFLQELGVLMPYANSQAFDEKLLIPGMTPSSHLQHLADKRVSEHDLVDTMKHLRHDWGDMPVFCIDNDGTLEVDDGISITPADVKDQYWIHAHIANPTAFIDRFSPSAELASHYSESIYFPERTWSMLRTWLTEHYCSLRSDRPCLTFSAKLDLQGTLLDYKIAPGTIRNVISMNYDHLAKILGYHKVTTSDLVLQVGLPPRPQASSVQSDPPQLSKELLTQLKTLQSLCLARTRAKVSHNQELTHEKNKVSVWFNIRRRLITRRSMTPYRLHVQTHRDDPSIELQTSKSQLYLTKAQEREDVLVQEVMLLAGEVAARWCDNRNIPLLYRGTQRRAEEDLDQAARKAFAELEATGQSIPRHLLFASASASYGVSSTRPCYHDGLKTTHYVKATSPLRRYGDMIVHWQIEACLRKEAEMQRPAIGLPPAEIDALVPFPRRELEKMRVPAILKEKHIARAKAKADLCWTLQLLYRAHHYGECELPRVLTAYVAHGAVNRHSIAVRIVELDLIATMLYDTQTLASAGRYAADRPEDMNEDLEPLKVGDVLQVQLHVIDVYRIRLTVLPTPLKEQIGHE